MSYAVKECFLTLQGEGAQAGRVAVFCRFTGCNLWSGREIDRATAACRFCDTDFRGTDGLGGGRFDDAGALADRIDSTWQGGETSERKFVVFTGGEPLLQLDRDLVAACHARGFEVAVETNGTKTVPDSVDWTCVSPKPRSKQVVQSGQELKLVFPQPEPEMAPEHFADLRFDHFYLQPMDGPQQQRNTELATAYCLRHPQWRLSVQTHKFIGIP